MGIIESFKPYKDKFGLISPDGNPSGNGLVYTAAYLQTLKDHNEIPLGELMSAYDVVMSCYERTGLLKRNPEHRDQEGPDDYIAIGLLSVLVGGVGGVIAKSVLAYGRANIQHIGPIKFRYVYNNECPGTFMTRDMGTNWSAWMGRFPALICHLEFAAGEQPNLFNRLAWIAAVMKACTASAKNQDSWTQTKMMCDVARGQGPVIDKVIKYFEYKLSQTFVCGIGQCWGQYFQNPEHPLAKWNIRL